MSVEIANNTTINAPTGGVFRFKFNRDINSILQRFASVHHGDDLEDFKDAWETFLKHFVLRLILKLSDSRKLVIMEMLKIKC